MLSCRLRCCERGLNTERIIVTFGSVLLFVATCVEIESQIGHALSEGVKRRSPLPESGDELSLEVCDELRTAISATTKCRWMKAY